MKQIGLTGGIASGKSSVASVLRRLGCPVIDADALAREVVAPGEPALAAIVRSFGPEMLLPDGQLDRKRLGAVVFTDPARRRQLEAITHPAIALRRQALWRELSARGVPVICNDIPLLFEGRMQSAFDEVWVVWVERATQLRRLMARDGIGPEQAEQRLAAQLPLDEKRGLAHVVIDNSGTPEETERQVRVAYAALLATA